MVCWRHSSVSVSLRRRFRVRLRSHRQPPAERPLVVDAQQSILRCVGEFDDREAHSRSTEAHWGRAEEGLSTNQGVENHGGQSEELH
jgi:hypothetical protein